MMRRLLYIIICVLTLAACSTTENIPEGETLYLGQKGIKYDKQPTDTLLHSAREHAAEKAAFATAKEEISAALAYEPNASLFGSSALSKPWKFGLWVYNKYADRERSATEDASGTGRKGFGHWLFKNFAEQPVLISTVAPQTRTKIATNTLHNYGYFRAGVDYTIVPSRKPKAARIAYNVTTGPLFHLDSVEYRSFGPVADSIIATSGTRPLLKSGDAFSVVNLSAEQTRIETIMRNNGYYFWLPSYTTFQADTTAVSERVQLRILPKADIPDEATHSWRIGNIYVSIRDQQNSPFDHEQASRRGNFYYMWSGKDIPAKSRLWRTAISHRSGRPYRLDDQTATINKLAALGILSSLDVNYSPRSQSASNDTLTSSTQKLKNFQTQDLIPDTLDVYISVTMGKPYDSSFEVNATLKSSQQLGPGVRYELAKRNAFRGGETVAWDIFGSYEWQLGRRSTNTGGLLNSYELGSSLKFEIPRFAFPFISKRRLRFPATTQFALEADWKNRSGFFQMLDFGANVTYNWQKAHIKHQWDLLDLDYYKLSHTTETFQEILDANPAISASMRSIFVPSMGYTLTYIPSRGSISEREGAASRGLWLQWSIKEGGNLTDAIHRLCYPHHDKTQARTLFGTEFAQFVKTTAEVHYTLPFSERFTLATRAFTGIIANYGSGTSAPYAEQFYIGGANSIRAFTVRTAGPGSYRSPNKKYAYIDQTGDFKLEANAELRARLFGSLHGAVFLDAGNVWLLHKDELRPGAELTASNLRRIALGTGAGLRYDLDFLILRIDVGIGLHAPYDTSRRGFYNFERFRDGVAYHFAIGYPF